MANYATYTEVATRLGRTLTADQQAQAEAVLGSIKLLIHEAAGKSADWVVDPVPAVFKALSIEKAVGVITNPDNLASLSEQLGAYQHSQTFPRAADIGIFLSDEEERRVRRAVRGHTAAAAPAGDTVVTETMATAGIYDIYHKQPVENW